MVDRSPMIAKAMSPVDIHALGHDTSTMPQVKAVIGEMTKPPHKPAAGSSPSASMFDGPFGGKKPQS